MSEPTDLFSASKTSRREDDYSETLINSKYQNVTENLKTKYLEPIEKYKNVKEKM